jgi:hypothetical protein
MDEREQRKRKERSDLIWTFLIIGGFLVAWPIGLVLAILKGRGMLPNIGMNTPTQKEGWRDYKVNPTSSAGQNQSQARPTGTGAQTWSQQAQAQAERAKQQAAYWAEQARQQAERTRQKSVQWAVPVHTQRASQTNPTAEQQAERQRRQAEREAKAQQQAAQAQQQAAKPAKEKKRDRLRFGKPMLFTGLGVSAVGAIALADSLAGVTSIVDFLRDAFFPAGLLAVGIYLTVFGFLRARQSKRLQEYRSIINPKSEYVSIHELADRTGRPYRQVLNDLQKMVELGVWEQAWIDRKHGRLMFTEYSAEQMVSGGKAEPKPEPASDKRAEEVLKRIRDDNDRIADREMSMKIDRIELLTGEIFRYLSKHPEREGELRTFMDYYLPQTLKILETYAQLEAQGVETDNIRKAKDQISDLLDQLTESYERQLDKLFDTDVLDISADIDVMKKMLQNDGLTPDELELELEKLQ